MCIFIVYMMNELRLTWNKYCLPTNNVNTTDHKSRQSMKMIYFAFLPFLSIFVGAQGKPNVLMIILDDLRPSLGCYGDKNAFTPNIDNLAKKSFIFTNVFAQQAVCAPSRNSFLTSRRPDTLHLYDFYSYWRDVAGNYTTLPQYFKENGYYTKSIGKVFHPGISSNNSDDYPLSWSEKPFHPSTEIYENTPVCTDRNGKLSTNLICPVIVEEQPKATLPDQESFNEAKTFLEGKAKMVKQPFFLAVGFHKPHIPFRFPREYLKYHPKSLIQLPENRWRPSLLPTVAWNPWTDLRWRDDIKKLNISFPFGRMPDEIITDIIQSYGASTSYVDDLIGELLKSVDHNTIILLFGDHGWSMGEHGEFSKYSNFDVATRVPLILHVPNLITRKTYINNLVELVDIFPTLVDLTDIGDSLETCSKNKDNQKLCTEGRSLIPLLIPFGVNLEEKPWKNAVFSQYPRPGVFPTENPNSDKPKLKQIQIMGYSIRTNQYRYTEWVKFNHTTFKPDWSVVYDRELYDHVIDPDENLNLATRTLMKDVLSDLRIKLILGWRYA